MSPSAVTALLALNHEKIELLFLFVRVRRTRKCKNHCCGSVDLFSLLIPLWFDKTSASLCVPPKVPDLPAHYRVSIVRELGAEYFPHPFLARAVHLDVR